MTTDEQGQCILPDHEFNVDCWMYSPHICGSQKLLDLLNSVGARYRAVPFDLFGNGRKPSKINGLYFIILLLDNISLMDASQSTFEVMTLESGEPVPSPPWTSHPVYAKIPKFVFRRDISPPPLYSCTETGWIMVNEAFVIASADAELIGPTFIELNDGVQYDAFEGL